MKQKLSQVYGLHKILKMRLRTKILRETWHALNTKHYFEMISFLTSHVFIYLKKSRKNLIQKRQVFFHYLALKILLLV